MQSDPPHRRDRGNARFLDASEKETRRFLEHVVHDLRTVRRGVGISAELLVRDFSTEPRAEPHQPVLHLQQSLAQMDRILSGIGDYCLALQSSGYSFMELPSDMLVRLALAASDKALEQQLRETAAALAYDGLPRVLGDRDRLTGLFRRLIDNALKYVKLPRPPNQNSGAAGAWCVAIFGPR